MKTLITLFLLFAASSAMADSDEAVIRELARRTNLSVEDIRTNFDACDSGVTRSMKICGSYRWTVEDIRLNALYKRALARAKERGYDVSLVRAQRAWLAYRDTACTYEGQMGAGGGSAEGLYVLGCKLDLTKQRAERFDAELREQQ